MAAVALITGASGLIGRHVIAQWDVDGLTALPVDHAADDLLEPGVAAALVERERPAVVVHLAWSASGTPGYRHSADNERWLRSSLELVRACEAHGAVVVVEDGRPAGVVLATVNPSGRIQKYKVRESFSESRRS